MGGVAMAKWGCPCTTVRRSPLPLRYGSGPDYNTTQQPVSTSSAYAAGLIACQLPSLFCRLGGQCGYLPLPLLMLFYRPRAGAN